MGGRLQVDPAELHAAGGTLQRVSAALEQRGDLGVGAGATGSPELSAAIDDFCQQAGDAATAFQAALSAASIRLHGGGDTYERTEAANAASFGS